MGDRVEERKISHEEYLSGKYQHVSHRGSDKYARVFITSSGDIDPDKTYTTKYLKKNGLGKFADSSDDDDDSEKSNRGARSNGSRGNSKNDDGYCVKLLFTIIPILPIWWIIKLPFSIITYPFRYMSSCNNKNFLPAYSFKNF